MSIPQKSNATLTRTWRPYVGRPPLDLDPRDIPAISGPRYAINATHRAGWYPPSTDDSEFRFSCAAVLFGTVNRGYRLLMDSEVQLVISYGVPRSDSALCCIVIPVNNRHHG